MLLVYFVLYYGAFSHSFVAYDDLAYVVQNPYVQEGLSLRGFEWAFLSLNGGVSYWHPLTWISHQLDVEIYGDFCGGHKLTNILLHLYSALLLFAFLRRLSLSDFVCTTVACLFLLHPLHVESVVWVSERKDVLCGFFQLIAFHAYLSYWESRSWRRLAAVYFWFVCALMSKPMAVTFPCLLLIVDFWIVRTRGGSGGPRINHRRRLLLEKIPLFLLAIGVGCLTLLAQRHLGVVPNFEELSLSFRIANAIQSYFLYGILALFPVGLAAHYPYPTSFASWGVLSGLIGFTMMWTWSLKVRQQRPVVMFGWAWYVIALLPVIGLIQTSGQARADRYMYLPLVGLSLIGCSVLDRWRNRFRWKAIEIALSVIIGFYCWMTWRQVDFWRDSETLFCRALTVTEENAVAHFGLAQSLDWGAQQMAIEPHFLAALAIEPENPVLHTEVARFYRYQSKLLMERTHLEKALAWGATDVTLEGRLKELRRRINSGKKEVSGLRH